MRILIAGIARKVGALAAAIALVTLLLPAQASAQSQIANPEALDALFTRLHNADNELHAQTITNEIWQIWLDPVDPVLNGLMYDALEARNSYNFEHALTILDDVVERWPDYAEGWNQRATLYFMMGRFEESLDDIDEVLEREPRHFGALSGQSLIYRQLGDDARALRAIIRALEYHPFLAERRHFPQLHDEPPTNI